MALRILALPFLTIILDHEPSKKELRRIRLSLNNAHKHMTPDQVADEISEHIQEENCSQEDAAEYFGISCGYVSKLLAPSKRLIAELRPLVGKPGISRDVLRVIAGMPTPEQQKQLAEQVLADVAREGRAKRDAVIRYADKLKGDKKPRKGTPLTLKADGIELKITKPLQEGIRAFLERVAGAMKKLKGDEDLHTALPFYFRSA
jgi:predicted XRE-type DNA-binding protein